MICKSHKNTPIHGGRIVIVITVTIFLLLLTCFWAINTGSIEITMEELFRGLLISYDKKVASIYDLRFPRIIIACIAGAALSVSGVLLQNVLKNPLTDPGIIGISSGASFAALLFSMLLPALYQWMPLASFLGGIVAFLLVYSLSYQRSLSSIRIILVGVTISTMFSGFIQALTAMSGNNQSSVAMIVNGNITMKTWQDVRIMLLYIPVFLLIAWVLAKQCNLMMLDDQTAKGIGVNVTLWRFVLSLLAVILASITTAIVGVVSFLGLIIPHMAKLLVGQNHAIVIPYAMILGAWLFLFADTLGRVIIAPYEISAAVVLSILGGPLFIMILRKRGMHERS